MPKRLTFPINNYNANEANADIVGFPISDNKNAPVVLGTVLDDSTKIYYSYDNNNVLINAFNSINNAYSEYLIKLDTMVTHANIVPADDDYEG